MTSSTDSIAKGGILDSNGMDLEGKVSHDRYYHDIISLN
jgi:hypothetical protein